MKLFRKLLLVSTFISIFNCQASDIAIWKETANGVWTITVGKPEGYNLTNELEFTPKLDVINSMGVSKIPIDKEEIKFEIRDGKTYIRFPLDSLEQIYGLGLNFKSINQRGKVKRLHVDHFSGKDDGRNHAPVPFFVSSKGYGLFINSARYLDIYVGTGVRKDSKHPAIVRDRNTDKKWSSAPYSDNLEILVPVAGVELILFTGENNLDVVRKFNLYQGGGCLPPRWGLGFWNRTPAKYSAEQVLEVVSEFKKRKFPLTVLGLEPGWMSGSYPCTYDWAKTKFPEPKVFVKNLSDQNIKVNVWVNPGISPNSTMYKDIEPFTGSHTEWCGVIPDLKMEQAKNILNNHLKKTLLDIDVSGLKLDENDGYDNWLWPDLATFPSGITGEQMRQTYGSLLQSTTNKLYKDQNVRTYGLVRASNAGTSSFPYVLYSDSYNHKEYVTALINSSFIGVLWTPEVRDAASGEEWVRRMQTVCFSPVAMLNAWADAKKPWDFPEVEKEISFIANLRMQLIPYLYTAFADYAFMGTPPVRAMNLVPNFDVKENIIAGKLDGTNNPYAIATKKEMNNQFMYGDALLVAPFFTGEKDRNVTLPKGKWYDFYTGKLVGEGEVIKITSSLDKIPVFVKDGGIVPMYPTISTLTAEKLPLEIRHYGQKASTYSLYDDDGNTYNYQKGEFTRINIEVNIDKKGKKIGKVIIPTGKKVWSFKQYDFHFMTDVE
jgi:alpha-D-xyloside xylohydrolase